MKPFRFYEVVRFPSLTLSDPRVMSLVQPSYLGDKEEPSTELILVKPNFVGGIDRHTVKSGVWKTAFGYVRLPVNGKIERLDLHGYIAPVELSLYHDRQRRLAIFQAPKKVCRGVVNNLRIGDVGVCLNETTVNLDKVCEVCPKYSAVWFRNLSSYMRSAAVSGNQLQNDAVFKKLALLGEKSNVVINWIYRENEHHIMVTESGIVVLVNDYRKTPEIELPLVLDVYDRVLRSSLSSNNSAPIFDDVLDPTNHLFPHPPKNRPKRS